MKTIPFWNMDAHYKVKFLRMQGMTYLSLFVEFSALKWSVQPIKGF